jgi:hypothetical protein
MGKCLRYEKTKYPTEEAAHRGLMWIWSHTNEDMTDLHVYQCEFCNKWHVGHISKFEKRKNGRQKDSYRNDKRAKKDSAQS